MPVSWGPSLFLPSPSLSGPFLRPPSLPFPSLPSPLLPYLVPSFYLFSFRSGHLNTAMRPGSAVSSPSGVWGEAPADKRFGAYLSQKGLLWWQQFFIEFHARIYVIFIIFCTKKIIFKNCVHNYHMITYGFRAHHVVFQIILNVLEVCFLH